MRIFKNSTRPEYTKRTGYLVGLCVKFSNLKWYTDLLSTEFTINKSDFELKKERVCENGYFSNCLVIHIVE